MDRLNFQRRLLAREIKSFNIELSQFSADCAFMSDAFSDLINQESHEIDSTTKGLQMFSQWVANKTHTFDKNMRDIKEKSDNVLIPHRNQF